jgi:hypothetical protein
MIASMLDFRITTIIDISALSVMERGQSGKGLFWWIASMRIMAVNETSIMTTAAIVFHQYLINFFKPRLPVVVAIAACLAPSLWRRRLAADESTSCGLESTMTSLLSFILSANAFLGRPVRWIKEKVNKYFGKFSKD